MKQIEVKFDAKAKDVLANTLDLGGSSMIEVPANSKITLDSDKLLQLLIAKNVDVDAEIEGYSNYTGLMLGATINVERYLSETVNTHIIYPYSEYDWSTKTDKYGIKWAIEGSNGTYAVKEIDYIEHITFKTMLQALGTVDVDVFNEIKLVPYVALKTSSQVDARPVDITTDEFLSFITITPANE